MRGVWSTAKEHWDQLATYICITMYGIAALSTPIPSTGVMPIPLAVLFYAELILAGIILLIALFTGHRIMKIIGYTVYIIGMFTIAGLVAVGSGNPVWLLIMGVGWQAMANMRYLTKSRKVALELSEVVEKLEGRDRDG